MTSLILSMHGSTAVLTMNRPEARNALDQSMREEFTRLVPQIRDDRAIKAVVLTGAGGHFCAGGDIKSMQATVAGKQDVFDSRNRMLGLHRWFDELLDLEKPVITAVQGSAFGAGLSLALAGDFVLAAPSAKFCCVFAKIGFVPDLGAMHLLPRLVGLQTAKELAFTARVVGAEEARQLGMAYRLTSEDVLADAIAFAERFANAPTEAIGYTKRVMNHSFESQRAEVFQQEALAQTLCRESAFHQEAIQRFVNKQPALYQWQD
ncbi:enoyl-CoA hydratase/carnithine racemase [Comamonas odontotermitis]|uniref:Enoyl-CoA hydratase/carnithine racemase n=1 Tax=Comamonas odontotermitis TaxID=379895 RepID=A0ABR6RFF1_9BURK|nr:enoyl-CoA hydratase/isomerase family protein [Comamonas odontotermitis]MBB6577874.1 enoyl-CoA hydratase/carnithine racemase [Comamonas odontotermitis]